MVDILWFVQLLKIGYWCYYLDQLLGGIKGYYL